MRLAFVANSYLDPRTPESWSGLPYFIRRSLEGAGVEVETCVLREPNPTGSLLRFAYWKLFRGKRFLRSCDKRLHKYYAKQIERGLRSLRADVVFCPSSWPVAYLQGNIPMVFWTDACFAGMLNFYRSFSNLAPVNVADGHAAESAALQRCSRAIYSSDWAAATARENYLADPSKIRVVPFAGNLAERPSLREVAAFVAQRDVRQCNLLFIGVDWERKGGEIAVEAVKSLNERGFNAQLTIVGCLPPPSVSLPSYVKVIPFIDKSTAEGSRLFNDLCRSSHFLMTPSRAEAFGLAIIEGNYFGLPCLATDVGGIPSIIVNEVNGRLFALSARGASYADFILEVMRDPGRYRSLALSSADFADRHYLWELSGPTVAGILNDVVAMKSSAPSRAI